MGLAVLLLLAATVPPFVNIKRFRRGIVRSISEGLGRPVRADSVELTLLPRPAFVLHGFTVAEDPAYGAEPVLMDDTVTASLRASTLWHRRVEIATLRFDAPSLNLTRNSAGHWNFEPLLHSSAPSPASRSGRTAVSTRMPFPYVEASEARINFKMGAEKLPFSLEGTDLAVWKESGSEWHLRLRARPVRTDLTVAGAGQIRGEAVLQAAGPLDDAPVSGSLEWRQVQLGEVERMAHGEDDNWRGIVDWTAHVKGTLASAQVSTDVQISEFRRAEFVPANQMELHGRCQGKFLRGLNALNALQCSVPMGTGFLRVQGKNLLPLSEAGLSPASSSSANAPATVLLLQHVPAQFFLELLRQIHPGVAGVAAISGELNGTADCKWAGLHLPRACTGQVQSTALDLTLPQLARPIHLSRFTLAALATSPGIWQLEPSHLSLGAAAPVTWSGTFTPSALTLKIEGPAKLREVVRLSQALRIPAISGQARTSQGSAQLALALQSTWLPQPILTSTGGPQILQFSPSLWTGTVQIRNAVMTLPALRGPLQLVSAQLQLTPDAVTWNRLSGTYGHIPFDGSLRWQTACAESTAACSRSFVLHAASLNTADFIAALHHGNGTSRLLDLVNPWAANAPGLPLLHGTVNVDRLTLGKLSIKNAALRLQMEGHAAELQSLSGNVFGGTISGGDLTGNDAVNEQAETHSPSSLESKSEPMTDASRAIGSVRWGDGPPAYTLRAALTRIQPARVAALWQEHWGGGVADAVFSLTAQGWSAADVAQHAQGRFSIHWVDGALGSPDASSTITFQRWRAAGRLAGKSFVLRSSQMRGWLAKESDRKSDPSSGAASDSRVNTTPAAGVQTVTGAVSFGRLVNLKLQPSGTSLTGTLDAPTVTEKKTKTAPADAQP